MKTTLVMIAASLGLASLVGGTGCAYRSPEMWRDDVGKIVAAKQGDMKSCYDGVLQSTPGAAGKVAVAFEVETENGKIQNVIVDRTKTTAPAPVQECVTKALEGQAVSPPDKRLGQGLWEFDFTPGASGPRVTAPAS